VIASLAVLSDIGGVDMGTLRLGERGWHNIV
jgi:hypothetical protein